jgi:chemotaxis protein MotB
MAINLEDEKREGPAEWVVTFGDMMSLLLTFFIMLVSMSEIKEEQRYQALVESLRKRFGHETSAVSMMPGPTKPRNSPVEKLASMGRARRVDTMRGGDRVKAPVGKNPRVKTLRNADHNTLGGEVRFPEGEATLDDAGKRVLRATAQEVGGKPQKIEVRGHTSTKPLPKDSPFRTHLDLAYARCVQVAEYLEQLGINPKRIRIAVAGSAEPKHIGADPMLRKQNSRVEVFMLDETVGDLEGTKTERMERLKSPPIKSD